MKNKVKEIKLGKINITVCQKFGSTYIYLSKSTKAAKTKEVYCDSNRSIIVDFNSDNKVIGIEIL